MADLKSPVLIWIKGGLFLFLGLLATALLLFLAADWKVLVLHVLAIWAFCRSYYFAFYVIQHYVDPEFRFAGLLDFLTYALRRWRKLA